MDSHLKTPQVVSLLPSSTVMPSFQPKPFPPPTLEDVPVEYIINQLQGLAPHYWNKPETADCTIVVPVPHPQGRAMGAPDTPLFPPETLLARGSTTDMSTKSNRRVTEPTLQYSPRISFELHRDYLSAQSTFLRGIFSGASTLDLINTATNAPPAFQPPPNAPSGPFNVPESRLPRLLPSSPNHPNVFLPIPDPTSFHLIVHWMYFGKTDHIEEALTNGTIQWEGLARNVEYLGLSADIKIFLGRWYSSWLHTDREPVSVYAYGEGNPLSSDSAESDSSDEEAGDRDMDIGSGGSDEEEAEEEADEYMSASSEMDEDEGENESTMSNDEEIKRERGRSAMTRFLANHARNGKPNKRFSV